MCVEVGGTITGEHGVGIEKINQMCVQFKPDELAAFRAVKRAFDPTGLLNPGKAVPTLHRCAEFGRMHVQRRAAAVSRAAAVLTMDATARLRRCAEQHPCALRRGAASRCASAAAAARISTARALDGEVLDTRAYARHRRLRADRTGDHRALRHAARRTRGGAGASRARCWRSSRRISAPARRSAAASPPACPGRAAPAAGAVRDFVLGVRMLDGARRRSALRRPGDEERRRLRRLAPDGRLARHARPDTRSVAQGAAAAVGRSDAALRAARRTSAIATLNDWGGQPLPISASAWTRRRARACACRARERRSSAAREAIGGEAVEPEQAQRFWRGVREQTRCRFSRSRRAAVAPVAAVDDAAAGAAGRAADRMGRRAALAARATPMRARMRDAAAQAGGHATLFRAAATSSAGVFTPLAPRAGDASTAS